MSKVRGDPECSSSAPNGPVWIRAAGDVRSSNLRDRCFDKRVGFNPAHTYGGWFVGGGTEYALNFSWMPIHGLFWRNEYRFSSFNKADLALLTPAGAATGIGVHTQSYEQAVLSELVWRFNWQ